MKKITILFSTGLVLFLSTSAYAEEIAVSGNGTGSDNQVSISTSSTNTTQQTNTADVQNAVAIDANTGNNTASANSGGDTAIQTGSIDINSTIDNSLNTSSVQTDCCQNGIKGTIAGNGSDSQNTVNFTFSTTNTSAVFQNTTIFNNILGSANTGGNTANDNSSHVSIKTGSIYASENIANGPINVSSIQNPAGFGADASFSIFGNGTVSTNTIYSLLNSSNNVYNIFNANIVNNSVWDLNTGNNYANGNIGGVDLETGDIFFASVIKNGPINVSRVNISCCKDKIDDPVGGNKPNDDPKPNPGTPAGSMGTSSGGNSSGNSSGGGGVGGIGSLLPKTGSLWTLIMTLASIVLFFFGWYLRFRSGNAPPRFAFATA